MMDFDIYHGRTEVFDLTITANAVAINLTGKTLQFSVKRDVTDSLALIEKDTTDGIVVTNAAAGQARVTLETTDTGLLDNREHVVVYDVHLVDGTADYQVLTGRLIVHPTIGEFGT
jgi:hypothetical protein